MQRLVFGESRWSPFVFSTIGPKSPDVWLLIGLCLSLFNNSRKQLTKKCLFSTKLRQHFQFPSLAFQFPFPPLHSHFPFPLTGQFQSNFRPISEQLSSTIISISFKFSNRVSVGSFGAVPGQF